MKLVPLNVEDLKLLSLAASALANWRETGDASLSRNDIITMGRDLKNIKALDVDQEKQILRLRELSQELTRNAYSR